RARARSSSGDGFAAGQTSRKISLRRAWVIRGAPIVGAMGACPSENLLAQFVEGKLSGAALADLTAHLDGCDECRLAAAAVMALTPTLPGTLPHPGEGRAGAGPE